MLHLTGDGQHEKLEIQTLSHFCEPGFDGLDRAAAIAQLVRL